MAVAGALIANIVIAASVTADGFGTGTLDVLWAVIFDEVLSIADVFYAAIAAALAAFYANRRLTRSEYQALRMWREEQEKV